MLAYLPAPAALAVVMPRMLYIQILKTTRVENTGMIFFPKDRHISMIRHAAAYLG
jgi:hypothetical protein